MAAAGASAAQRRPDRLVAGRVNVVASTASAGRAR
jgi:hypothetical protein